MVSLILGGFLAFGVLLMLADLILIEKKSVRETLVTMQFFLPKKPLGIIGNIIVIISAIFLVLLSTV